jgi:hypothetical protein
MIQRGGKMTMRKLGKISLGLTCIGAGAAFFLAVAASLVGSYARGGGVNFFDVLGLLLGAASLGAAHECFSPQPYSESDDPDANVAQSRLADTDDLEHVRA